MVAKLFLIVLVLVGLAIIGLCIGIILKHGFPETHIGRNKDMKERGIKCAKVMDTLDRKNYKPVDTETLDFRP